MSCIDIVSDEYLKECLMVTRSVLSCARMRGKYLNEYPITMWERFVSCRVHQCGVHEGVPDDGVEVGFYLVQCLSARST